MNILNVQSNVLTNEQKEDITQVLKSNNITLDCTIPDKFSPMSALSMEMYEFDYLKMQKIFFGNINDVVRTDVDNSVVFKKDDSTLILKNNTFSYSGKCENISDIKDAKKISEKYIKEIMGYFGNYSFYKESQTDNVFQVEYIEKYNRNNIFVNYVVFNIENDTINIEGQYYKVKENTGSTSAIISADEALFSAIPYLNEVYENGCSISNIELGYYYNNTIMNKEITVSPTYKITAGNNVFYVNGYSGVVE